MLQSIREGMVSPFAKFLLFVLAGAMVGFYGFSGSCGGAISENISASVDGEEISQNDLARAFQDMLAYQQSQGIDFNNLPPEMITMFQKQVLQGLIQQKLLLQQAKALGMVMPKKAIQKNIHEQFTQGGAQKFDFQQYKNILSRFGQTPAQFEKQQGEKIIVNSLYQAMNTTTKTPTHLLKADYAINNTKAKVSYIKLNASTVQNKLGVQQPSQEQLKDYFEQNKENYRIPAQRDFSLYWLDLTSFLPQANDDDLNQTLKSTYNTQQKEKLSQTRYHARHILIDDANQSKAQKIYQRLRAGESFSKLAFLESEDPGSKNNGGDLGYFSADAMVPEFQHAVESLKVGQISSPVKSSFGYHIIELLDKIEPGPVNITRLKKELNLVWQSRALEQDKYKNIALDAAKKVFARQAKKRDYTGINQNDNLPQAPDSNDTSIIMGKAMSSELNQKSELFTAASLNYIYQIEVHHIKESDIPNYDTLAQTIKTDYLQQAYQKAFSTLIAQKNQNLLKKEVANLQDLASELGVAVQTTDWFSAKDTSKLKSDLNIEDLKPALSMQKADMFTKSIVQGKDHYFLSVADIQMPDWSKFDASTASDRNALNMQRVNQWINSLKENANITITPELQDS